MPFFLIIDGAQAGPFTADQFETLRTEGRLTPETLYWHDGMTEWQPFSTFNGGTATLFSQPEQRVYAGFWRRFAAFLVDAIVLGMIGFILAQCFFDFFSRLGSMGPLIGLGISWLYFGLLDSALFQGKTTGKRLLKIEVIGADGKNISPATAFLRFAVWGLPYFLWTPLTGSDTTSAYAMVVSLILFLWLSAIVYLFIFNRPTRQSLQDWLTETYVVKTTPRGLPIPAPFWKPHLAIIAALAVATLGLFALGYLLANKLEKGSLSGMFTLQRALLAKPEIQMASVMVGKNVVWLKGETRTSTSLNVVAEWNGKPKDIQAAAREVAAVILYKDLDEASQLDGVTVTISYGYRIGIASAHVTEVFRHRVSDWQKIVQDSTAP